MKEKLIQWYRLKQQTQRSVGVNLPRQIQQYDPDLYQFVLDQTSFLNHRSTVNFNERIWCVMNDVHAVVLNAFGNPAEFVNINRGYCLQTEKFRKYQKGLQNQQQLAQKRARKSQQRNQSAQLLEQNPNYFKIQEFVKRNRKRNQHLYANDQVEGIDYVVCPVTHERMCMIRRDYITKVLGLTVEHFDQEYPSIKKICDRRIDNVKFGLQQIDPQTGLTKHQLAIAKSKQILATLDVNGVTGYQKLGQKTKAAHIANVDEQGRNGYQRQVLGRLTTVLPNGLTVEQNAHIKQRERLFSGNKGGVNGASKISKKVLKPIMDFLDSNSIRYYFDAAEYSIKDTDTGKYYFFDLTVPDLEIAIEYQSCAWHADPTLPEDEWRNWKKPIGETHTAEQILEYDYNKARALYKHRGIVTYYVWERSRERDVQDILCLLKTKITKF